MNDLSFLRNYMHAANPLSCIENMSVVRASSLGAFGEIGSNTSRAPVGSGNAHAQHTFGSRVLATGYITLQPDFESAAPM
jgi:hypothetical protein